MTMLSTLLLYAALSLPGATAAQASYGEVIEVMARQAARLREPGLMELVSDVGLRFLEREQWRERHPSDTLREVGRRLRNQQREVRRTRAQRTQQKREERARAGKAPPKLPVAREQLGLDRQAELRLVHDDEGANLQARQELAQLGFAELPADDQQLLFATEVMGLRYAAAGELVGIGADQARHRRNSLLAKLRAAARLSA